ncbi:MAG: hypothetical protein HYT14_01350 [Candidatus Liptonbacteria bacterium]|nr:hypothetical protein [Candidatus Liptonbacteria bacterium]
MERQLHDVLRDAAIVALSILIAIFLVAGGTLHGLIASLGAFKLLGSFLAGIFFTSLFTAAPATVVLAEIAQTNSVFWSAVAGGFGALLGDMIIFRFVRNELSADILFVVRRAGQQRLITVFGSKALRWTVPIVGALIIASPFPDELGLMMLGLGKVPTHLFAILAFLLNFFGILVIGIIAKGSL